MNIVHLMECTEVVPTLAGWIVTQWGYMNPALTVETMSEKLKE